MIPSTYIPRICRNRRWISAFKRAHFLSIMIRIEAFTVHAFNLLTYTSWMPCQHLSKGTHFLKLWGDIQGNYSTLLVFKIFLWSRLFFTNFLDTKRKWSYYVSTYIQILWPEFFSQFRSETYTNQGLFTCQNWQFATSKKQNHTVSKL